MPDQVRETHQAGDQYRKPCVTLDRAHLASQRHDAHPDDGAGRDGAEHSAHNEPGSRTDLPDGRFRAPHPVDQYPPEQNCSKDRAPVRHGSPVADDHPPGDREEDGFALGGLEIERPKVSSDTKGERRMVRHAFHTERRGCVPLGVIGGGASHVGEVVSGDACVAGHIEIGGVAPDELCGFGQKRETCRIPC